MRTLDAERRSRSEEDAVVVRGSPTRRFAAAFTILEMLVAVAITLVMVLFLNQIFTSIAGTVTLGVATSDIIQANAFFTKQLGDDAEAMTGPLENGFLVILQYQVNNAKLRAEDTTSTTLRSDQIIWIRST